MGLSKQGQGTPRHCFGSGLDRRFAAHPEVGEGNKKRAEARFLLYPQLPVDYLLRPSTALRRLYRA